MMKSRPCYAHACDIVIEKAWTFTEIGRIHSPLKEKFGTPRQPGLANGLKSRIEIYPSYAREEAFRGLAGYSHIWILSVFHLVQRQGWLATVRPPRLGGNERVGVFASRSPYRPNPISLSVCELAAVVREQNSLFLRVNGCDLVDGTPVLDIKPYLPYSDCLQQARAGYAPSQPQQRLQVSWSVRAREALAEHAQNHPDLQLLVEELVSLDPRPAYHQAQADYGMRLYEFNIRFSVAATQATILSIEPV